MPYPASEPSLPPISRQQSYAPQPSAKAEPSATSFDSLLDAPTQDQGLPAAPAQPADRPATATTHDARSSDAPAKPVTADQAPSKIAPTDTPPAAPAAPTDTIKAAVIATTIKASVAASTGTTVAAPPTDAKGKPAKTTGPVTDPTAALAGQPVNAPVPTAVAVVIDPQIAPVTNQPAPAKPAEGTSVTPATAKSIAAATSAIDPASGSGNEIASATGPAETPTAQQATTAQLTAATGKSLDKDAPGAAQAGKDLRVGDKPTDAHPIDDKAALATATTPAIDPGALADGGKAPVQPAQTGLPQPTGTAGADATTAANAASTSAQQQQTALVPVPVTGLAVTIASRAQAGSNRFEIRLDPPELGRIDVHLDVDKHGEVTSRLVVDRPETLDLLRRDAPQLQQALQDAGLKTSDNGLQFSLRDQSFAGRDDSSRNSAPPLIVPDHDSIAVESVPTTYGRLLRSGSGVDIRV